MTRYDEFTLTVRSDQTIDAKLETHDKKSRNELGQLPTGQILENIRIGVRELERGDMKSPERLKQLGDDLYRALFPDPIGQMFEQAVETVRSSRRQGEEERSVRLVINVEDPHSDISSWPLEFLRCPGRTTYDAGWWLGTEGAMITLSRRLVLRGIEISLESEKKSPPLRVLVIVSRPSGLPGVMAAPVLRKIANLSKGEISGQQVKARMEVKIIGKLDDVETQELEGLDIHNEPATYQNIREQTEGINWLPDVLHFIGHGDFDHRSGGLLELVDSQNDVDWCSADDFSQLSRALNLRLVLLQACESAQAETGSGFMSLAAHLVQHQIPAVVAMQFAIRNDYATEFAVSFYQALKEGKDIDAAVQKGRWTMSNKIRWREPQFGAPVLFQYDPTGILIPLSSSGSAHDRTIRREAESVDHTARARSNLESAQKLIQENCVSDAIDVLRSARDNLQSTHPQMVARVGIVIDMLQGGDDPQHTLAIISRICDELVGLVPMKPAGAVGTIEKAPAKRGLASADIQPAKHQDFSFGKPQGEGSSQVRRVRYRLSRKKRGSHGEAARTGSHAVDTAEKSDSA